MSVNQILLLLNKFKMEQNVLVEWTKQKQLFGQDKMQILEKFMSYCESCKDPQNIFRYMEEKIICTYLAHFWIFKSNYLAQIGDYSRAYESLKVAEDRSQIEPEDEVNINQLKNKLITHIIFQIKSFPIKSKRTIQEYTLFNSTQYTDDYLTKILQIYNNKYNQLRAIIQTKFQLKRQNKPLSWIGEIYKQQQQIKGRIKSISNTSFIAQDNVSLNTPLRYFKKIPKPLDSVELLKRKKRLSRENQTSNNLQENEEKSHIYNSLPVGKNFVRARKTVTFSEEKSQLMRREQQKMQKRQSLFFRKSSLKSHKTEISQQMKE